MAAEKQFENKVKGYLKKLPGCWFIKYWGGGMSKAGIPDILCCINGIFMSIELKASNGKPTELQKYNTRLINQAAGIGIILYPEGFENFKNIIQEVIKCSSHIQELNHLKIVHSNIKCDILMK